MIVTKDKEFYSLIRDILANYVYNVELTLSATSARQRCYEANFDLVLINTPLKDEFGVELAIDLSEKSNSSIMLLIRNELLDQVEQKINETGIYLLTKPFSKEGFLSGILFVKASYEKINKLNKEKEKLQQKLNDLKVIHMAKCLLIENEGFREDTAHKHIEKEAMNKRVSKLQIAEAIIDKYYD